MQQISTFGDIQRDFGSTSKLSNNWKLQESETSTGEEGELWCHLVDSWIEITELLTDISAGAVSIKWLIATKLNTAVKTHYINVSIQSFGGWDTTQIQILTVIQLSRLNKKMKLVIFEMNTTPFALNDVVLQSERLSKPLAFGHDKWRASLHQCK